MNNSITNKALIESFIDGEEYGVESFVENGNIHVLGVMKKWMTEPPYYAELGHAIPSGLSQEIEEKIRQCVKNAIRALNINFGSVNMDLLVSKEGTIHIVDVGARMGGNLIGSHIVYKGTGIDYLANLIKAAVNDTVDFEPRKTGTNVVTRLLALQPGMVKELPDFEQISQKYKVDIYHHIHTGEMINEYHTNLDGCGYIVSTNSSLENAIENAEMAKFEIDNGILRG